MARLRVSLIAVCLLVMLGKLGMPGGPVRAQSVSPPGRIEGRVIDEAGANIPGAAIELLINGRSFQHAISDEHGAFTFEHVPAGVCLVRASLNGFMTESASITVTSGGRTNVTVRLRVAGLTETVMVTAAPSQLQASQSRIGGSREVIAIQGVRRDFNREQYAALDTNDFRSALAVPLSTFSIDVDTASYANARRFIREGQLPPAESIRLEEFINYFEYDYPDPDPAGAMPFGITSQVTTCPWNPRHRLALIGLQAKRQADATAPPRNLVFLIDVSGSMDEPNKLPLVRTGLQLLVDRLRPQDRVAVVVYAGASGLALPSTPGDRKERIRELIASLEPGGSTNGAEGIVLAYQVAQKHFIKGGINRVILATDGDFNVGVTSQGALEQLIADKRDSGIFCRCSASAKAICRMRRWRCWRTRGTAITPTSIRCRKRIACSSSRRAGR